MLFTQKFSLSAMNPSEDCQLAQRPFKDLDTLDEFFLVLSTTKCSTDDTPPLPRREKLPKLVTELSLIKSIFMKGSPMEAKDKTTTILIVLLMNDCNQEYLVPVVSNEKLRHAERYKRKIQEFKENQGMDGYDWQKFVRTYFDKVKEYLAGYFVLWAAQEMRECRFKSGYNPAQQLVADIEHHRRLSKK